MNHKELECLSYVFQTNKDIWIKNKDLINKLKDEITIIWGDDFVSEISQAHLRQLIKELRKLGYIIIASNLGYKLTTNLDEITHYLKSRWGELTREMKVLKTIAQKSDLIGQLTLWESEAK